MNMNDVVVNDVIVEIKTAHGHATVLWLCDESTENLIVYKSIYSIFMIALHCLL
jgi:hypothetical protein